MWRSIACWMGKMFYRFYLQVLAIANTLIFQTWVQATSGLVCSGLLQCWSKQEEQLFLFNITH